MKDNSIIGNSGPDLLPVEAIEARLRDAGLVPPDVPVRFVPLTGGVASDIWRVDAGTRSFAVKRALPKLRVAADWHAPVSRNAAEADWLRIAARIVPAAVPRILFHDPDAGLFAMDYLPPDSHPVWKAQLRDGIVDIPFARAVGRTLAKIHAASAGDPEISARFALDETFHAIRLEPYLEATARRHPKIADRLFDLSRRTLACHRTLVHGDVSPKNILVGPEGPVFLDAECAWYGDPAFDLAFCLNHLLLKCTWNPGAAELLLTAFDALQNEYLGSAAPAERAGTAARAAHLLPALLLARVDGKSPVEYITRDADRDLVRAVAVPLIADPPDDLASVRNAWAERVTKIG
ncbi:MAG: phosphotransferase [Proteobacteria bacterium]|nr:phosphotransferase [Pseudomonadota bacterium]